MPRMACVDFNKYFPVGSEPGRKVQRDTGVDMPRVVRALRAGGIGSGSATDPRGLDAVVAEVVDRTSASARLCARRRRRACQVR